MLRSSGESKNDTQSALSATSAIGRYGVLPLSGVDASTKRHFTLCIAVLCLIAFGVNHPVFAQGPNLHGLYVPPSNSFIENPSEARITLNFGTLPLSQVQSKLDSARASDPSSPIVLTLTGTYFVRDTPLALPSHTSLVLYGSISALPGTSATSLISITGQTDVSISGGQLEGTGTGVAGVDAESSTKINIDNVTISNTGRDGIVLNGTGNTSTDSGSAITRCEVSFSGGNGINVGLTTQALVLDNLVRDNKGAGVQVGSAFTSVVNNVSRNNNIGIEVNANDDLIADNDVRENPSGGILLHTASANTVAMRNIVSDNSQVGIDLDGTNNLVYDNMLNNPVNLTERAAGNWVLPRGTPLTAQLSNYFFPPTIDNQHDEPIMNDLGRTDLTLTSSTITAVQQAYDTAVQANPNNVVVLHLNGAFTVDAAPLTLASNTAVILNGSINNGSTTARNLITAKNPVQFISFSGGTVDCGGKVMEPIAFTSPTMRISIRSRCRTVELRTIQTMAWFTWWVAPVTTSFTPILSMAPQAAESGHRIPRPGLLCSKII